MTDAAIIKWVRTKTTDSTVLLPDPQILYFAGKGALPDEEYNDNVYSGVVDLYGVTADCWLYISRNIQYASEQVGTVAVSKPVALDRYKEFLALSIRGGGDGTGIGGNVVGISGVVTRSDLLTSPRGTEFGT